MKSHIIEVVGVDPGKIGWGMALIAADGKLVCSFHSGRTEDRDLVNLLDDLESSIREDLGVNCCLRDISLLAVEGTYHGKMGKKQIASLNQTIGLWKAWALRVNSWVKVHVVSVGFQRRSAGWMGDLGLKGADDAQIKAYAKATEGLKGDIKDISIHEAEACLIARWAYRRLDKLGGKRWKKG